MIAARCQCPAPTICYARDELDKDLLTVMVGKLYPSKAQFASACDVKRAQDEVVGRLARFLHDVGVNKMVYKTDQ